MTVSEWEPVDLYKPIALITLIGLTVSVGCSQQLAKLEEPVAEEEVVVFETSQGRIVIELYEDDAPLHVENYRKLVTNGYYQGEARTFHRWVDGFVIQGGDPLGRDSSRAGTGGPGYTIPAEIKRDHLLGSVAAARTGDAQNPKRASSGSQFYICLDALPGLDGDYSVFGQVIEGMDAAMKLRVGDEITEASLVPRSAALAE